MNKVITLFLLFLIFGNYSCKNSENNNKSSANPSSHSNVSNLNTQNSKFEPNGYYNPIGDSIYLDKYRFENLVIWLPSADEKPEVFLHFTNFNLKRKAINIYFKNYIIKPENILLSESDTLNGQISFEGKFLKEIEPSDEDARNETVVLTGKLRIRDKVYNLDFTFFPGD